MMIWTFLVIAKLSTYVLDLQHVVRCRDIREQCRYDKSGTNEVEEPGSKRAGRPILQIGPSDE